MVLRTAANASFVEAGIFRGSSLFSVICPLLYSTTLCVVSCSPPPAVEECSSAGPAPARPRQQAHPDRRRQLR